MPVIDRRGVARSGAIGAALLLAAPLVYSWVTRAPRHSGIITRGAANAAVSQPGRAKPFPPADAWALAFVREGDIWTAQRDGSHARLVIGHGESPSWSPDKSRIAFSRDGNIWVANPDGSGQQQSTFRWTKRPAEYAREIDIAWHPRGRFLTFSHPETFEISPAGSRVKSTLEGESIFDMPVEPSEGSEPNRWFALTDDEPWCGFTHSSHPAWSKSGRFFAFVRNGDLWLAKRGEPLGGDEYPWFGTSTSSWGWEWSRLLATADYDAASNRGWSGSSVAANLSWSPDETALVYGTDYGPYGSVMMLSLKTGKARELDFGRDPCFSPDGRWVAYHGFGPNPEGVCIIRAFGGRGRLIIRGAEQPAW